jgi:hypothetical protein
MLEKKRVGRYELFAVQETVCDEFAGAESCTFVGLHGLACYLKERGGWEGGAEFFLVKHEKNSSIHPSPTTIRRLQNTAASSLSYQ